MCQIQDSINALNNHVPQTHNFMMQQVPACFVINNILDYSAVVTWLHGNHLMIDYSAVVTWLHGNHLMIDYSAVVTCFHGNHLMMIQICYISPSTDDDVKLRRLRSRACLLLYKARSRACCRTHLHNEK
jgi:hypothetical protein